MNIFLTATISIMVAFLFKEIRINVSTNKIVWLQALRRGTGHIRFSFWNEVVKSLLSLQL
jgi:hypothetical protein